MEVVGRRRGRTASVLGVMGAWLLACGPSSSTTSAGPGAGGAPGESLATRAGALTATTPGLQTPRAGHTVTPLRDGRLLVAGGESLGLLEVYDPLTGRSLQAPPLKGPRRGHRAVALPSGQVVLIGGQTPDGTPVLEIERYTPASGASAEVTEVHGALVTGRQQPGVALLASGQVLIVGGQSGGAPVVERLDPATGLSQALTVTWAGGVVPELTTTQAWLRGDGKVWFHGRVASPDPDPPAERFFAYDPATQVVAVSPLTDAQEAALQVSAPTAVLTPGDTLVITGGTTNGLASGTAPVSAEVTWSNPDSSFSQMALGQPQRDHTATALPSGRLVLVGPTASQGAGAPSSTVQVADLDARASSIIDTLTVGLTQHTTTPLAWGQALTLGGRETSSGGPPDGLLTNNARVTEEPSRLTLWGTALPPVRRAVAIGAGALLMSEPAQFWWLDPVTGAVSAVDGPQVGRTRPALVPLADGRVVLVGGGSLEDGQPPHQVEVFDVTGGRFTVASQGFAGREDTSGIERPVGPPSVLMLGGQISQPPAIGPFAQTLDVGTLDASALDAALPQQTWEAPRLAWLPGAQRVLVSGCVRVSQSQVFNEGNQVELYDPTDGGQLLGLAVGCEEAQAQAPGGDVFLHGGRMSDGTTLPSLRRVNASGQVEASVALGAARWGHGLTVLDDGKLMVLGGSDASGALSTVERLDPATGVATAAAPLALPRASIEQVVTLSTGERLVLGGGDDATRGRPELYSPATGTTRLLGAAGSATPATATGAVVTALMSGELLVTGGGAGVGWRLGPTGAVLGTSQGVVRVGHTATLLGDGRVLLVGGGDDGNEGGSLASVELYDPATRTFVATTSLGHGRRRHAATLLPSGEVLITGGVDASGAAVAEVERFTPAEAASGSTFTTVGKLHIPRWDHGSSLLADGTVWVAGGVVAEAKPAVTTERVVQGADEGVLDTPVTVPGRAAAVSLATGEALVAGDGVALVRGQDGVMTPLSGAPAGRVDLVPMPSGYVMLCGDQACARFDPRSRRIGTARPIVPLAKEGCALRSRAVVCAARPGDAVASVVTIEPEVRADWQPTLTGVPAEVAPGESTTLTGTRLTGPLAGALAAAAPAPQVLLLPFNGGPPRAGRVSSWSETSVTFVDPPTPFHGPTLVYVSQGGVLSEAQATVVRSSPQGTACEVDGECGSGFCTDGVCCDTRCRGNCEACLAVHQASGLDGVCGPITAGTDPRNACDRDPDLSCGRTGVCDGNRQCARDADGTSCGDASTMGTCQAGACVTGARCQGNDLVDPTGTRIEACSPYLCEEDHCASTCEPTQSNSCASGYSCTSQGYCRTCSADRRSVVVDETTTLPCAPYECSNGECLGQCTEDANCGTNYRCLGGLCGPFCDGNVSTSGQQVRPCAPYQCTDGRCPRACDSNLECAPGHVCALDRTCVPTPVSSSSSSSCAASRGPLPASPAPLLFALLGLGVTLRRRRVRPRASLAMLLLASRAGAQATAPSAAPAAGPGAATSEDDLRRAKDEFRHGVALFEAGDYETALEAFTRSREAYPSKHNTLNLALTLQKLGRVDEALDLYEEAITRFASELSAADRASVPATVAGLRAQLGELTVTATVDGLVLVDGRARGRLPLVRPLRLVAGTHRVRVLKDGYEPAEATVHTEAGSSSTIDLRPSPLRSVGRLRVEAGTRGSVVIDGATVGDLPWEGSLPPGSHLVAIEGEHEGSAPARVTVLEGQITLLRPRIVPLGPVVSLDAEPAQAELRLDGVSLGRGHWQGRLPLGTFRFEAREEGYEPAVQPLVVDAQPQHVALRLAIDPRHPRWPRRLPGVFTATAAVGYALGPSLRGGADATCASSCSSRGLVNGPLLTLRLGYELPSGLAFELSGGYLSLHQSLTRTFDARFPRSSRDYAVHYRLDETPELSGPWVGAGASLHVALGPVALRTRMLLGLARLGGRAPLSGQASTDAGASDVIIPESAASASSTPLLMQTEVGIERRLGPWNLGGSLGLLVVTTGGSDFERRSLVVPPSCSSSDPGAIGCAPVTRLPGPDRTHGPFAVLVPQITLQRAFD